MVRCHLPAVGKGRCAAMDPCKGASPDNDGERSHRKIDRLYLLFKVINPTGMHSPESLKTYSVLIRMHNGRCSQHILNKNEKIMKSKRTFLLPLCKTGNYNCAKIIENQIRGIKGASANASTKHIVP